MSEVATLRVVKELTPTLFVVEVTYEGESREVRMSRNEYLVHSAVYSAISELMDKRKAADMRERRKRAQRKAAITKHNQGEE